jgi:shikimate kinase
MLLTQSEFDERYKRNDLRIALIGMSNIGKSHWARRFNRNFGFTHYEVDDRIQENLSLSSIASSAAWMGHPYDKGYAEKSSEYLKLEEKLTASADDIDGNIILDTTGSVIYLSDEATRNLQDNYLVFYLTARDNDLDRLVKRFKTSPKPLIWGDHFKQIDGKSDEDSMFSLYPSLLEKRDSLYRGLADIEIQARRLGNQSDLIKIVRDKLPTS